MFNRTVVLSFCVLILFAEIFLTRTVFCWDDDEMLSDILKLENDDEKQVDLRNTDISTLSSAQEGFSFISKIRNLEYKAIPEIRLITKVQYGERINNKIEKDNKAKDGLEKTRKLFIKIGLISKDEEFGNDLSDEAIDHIAGFYDPDEKRIWMVADAVSGDIPGLDSIIHEEVHSLQDQHYDLNKLKEAALAGKGEEWNVFKSVVEGDATVMMFDAYLDILCATSGTECSAKDRTTLRKYVFSHFLDATKNYLDKNGNPALFTEMFLFPYVWGGSFIQYAVRAKGWNAVSDIYSDLPRSCEQIMHPEKYFIERDQPKEAKLADLSDCLGPGWLKVNQGTLGEFAFYIIGKKFLKGAAPETMSEGWGGDSFALYEEARTGRLLIIMSSVWDSEHDASEFFSLYKKVILKKYNNPAAINNGGNFAHWRTSDGNAYVLKREDSVFLIEGATDDILPTLIEKLS